MLILSYAFSSLLTLEIVKIVVFMKKKKNCKSHTIDTSLVDKMQWVGVEGPHFMSVKTPLITVGNPIISGHLTTAFAAFACHI